MPAALRSFVPNPTFGADVRTSPQMRQILTEKCRASVVAAKAIAPVGDPSDPRYASGQFKPGDYRRSIRFRVGIVNYPGIGRTLVGHVFATDYKAHWIEDGTVKQPPQAILKRGVEVAAPGAGFTAFT